MFVKDAYSLDTLATFSCTDSIDRAEWSPQSTHILVYNTKRGCAEVFAVDDPEWTCRIDEGSTGLRYARFSACGSNVLTVSEFNLKLTVWHLSDGTCSYLRGPKLHNKGVCYSRDTRFFAVLERRNASDFVSIYHAESCGLVISHGIPTLDCQDIVWTEDGASIVAIDSSITCMTVWVDCQIGAVKSETP